MYVARAGFLSFVAAIAAATSCSSAGQPLPNPAPAPVPTGTAAPPDDDDDDTAVIDAAAPPESGSDGGETCTDADGVTTTCDGVAGADACSAKTCQLALDELKSGVARQEIDCMRAQLQAGANCVLCRRVAITTACADTSVDGACDRIKATCKPGLDMEQCRHRMAGLSFLGRQRFIACMTESSCQRELTGCERLPPPPG